MHGTIREVLNQSTIIEVFVTTDEGRSVPVNFDHRTFSHMIEARGATKREDLVGQGVGFELDGIGGVPVLSFDDEGGR